MDAYTTARNKVLGLLSKGLISDKEAEESLAQIKATQTEDKRTDEQGKRDANSYDPTADKVLGAVIGYNGTEYCIASYNGHEPRLCANVIFSNGKKSKGKVSLAFLDGIRKMSDAEYMGFIGASRTVKAVVDANVKPETRNRKQEIPAQIMTAPTTDTARIDALEGNVASILATMQQLVAQTAPKARKAKAE
jgi:hypothetical protein